VLRILTNRPTPPLIALPGRSEVERAALSAVVGKPKALRNCLQRPELTERGPEHPAQWGGLDCKKACGHRRSVFSLVPTFIELIGA